MSPSLSVMCYSLTRGQRPIRSELLLLLLIVVVVVTSNNSASQHFPILLLAADFWLRNWAPRCPVPCHSPGTIHPTRHVGRVRLGSSRLSTEYERSVICGQLGGRHNPIGVVSRNSVSWTCSLLRASWLQCCTLTSDSVSAVDTL